MLQNAVNFPPPFQSTGFFDDNFVECTLLQLTLHIGLSASYASSYNFYNGYCLVEAHHLMPHSFHFLKTYVLPTASIARNLHL